tara:strand:+ start:611 stop:1048 length:438 start_codon:yes stop_codon:yes gene_type:complete
MVGKDEETEEPLDGSIGTAQEASPQPKVRRRSFGKVRRELSEDELGSPGVQKMLLDELERLDGIEEKLNSVSTEHQTTSESLAVAEQKLKTHTAFDVISVGTVAAGSILIGAAINFVGSAPAFWIPLVVGIVLIVVGVVAKVIRA